jgi:hypothetical protein
MPSYFPENNIPLPTDTVERSLQKAVSLISSAVEDGDPPTPSDSNETLAQKLVKSLGSAVLSGNITVLSGPGEPTEAASNGTLYIRTDGAASTTLYVRAGGAWSPLASYQ